MNKAKIKMILAMTIFGTIGLCKNNIAMGAGMVAMMRGFLGCLFLVLVTLVRKQKIDIKAMGKNFWILAVTGAFIGINWVLLFEGFKYTVAKATLSYYLEPVFLVLFAAVVYKEKISGFKAVCIGTALLGMCFVSGVLPALEVGGDDFKGILFGTGAAVFYTLVILTNRKIKDVSSYDMTIVQLFIASLVTVPYVLIVERGAVVASGVDILLLAVMGIVHTGVAYVLYFSAVRDLSAQSVAILSYIDPMVAIVLSMTLLGEVLSPWSILGAVLILGSTLLSELKKSES